MNSYFDTYQPGDFILHFAGTSGYKVPLMTIFSAQANGSFTNNSVSELASFHGAIKRLARV